MSDIRKDLSNSVGDYAHSAVKTALAAIPFLGGPASELFSLIIAPPVSKRRDEWMIRIADKLEELCKSRMLEPQTLVENELFITTVLQATQSAVRNHQEEKLTALQNAVLNSATGIAIEENVQLMFLSLIDTLTPWHLRVLSFFRNPHAFFKQNNKVPPNLYMGSPAAVLEAAYPELHGKKEFYNIIVKDLYNNGLLGVESLNGSMTESGTMAPRNTEFGNLFLSYITAP